MVKKKKEELSKAIRSETWGAQGLGEVSLGRRHLSKALNRFREFTTQSRGNCHGVVEGQEKAKVAGTERARDQVARILETLNRTLAFNLRTIAEL